ncbi:hypothetical protein [Flavobacterium macrobrachii]|jgi:hypothetical protein|uniref:hypothetical protein n=1 Tax=Flavobacterium macrobrachii TaxID=591204 RepID=UPI0037C18F56
MTLKNYIGLKFIWTLLFFVLAYFSASFVGNKYDDLKKENEELKEQKKYYEQILKLKPEEIEAKKNLYINIQVTDKYLKKINPEDNPNFSTYLLIMLISFGIYFTIYNFLDRKIEKLKLTDNKNNELF